MEKKDCINKIELLQADLDIVISDIPNKAKFLKDYYEEVYQNPLQTHLLKRTVSTSYRRVLENDRLSIFSGFTKYLNQHNNAIKQFSELYNILDHLSHLFDEIYNKYDYHTKDNYDLKIKIKDGLSDLNDSLFHLVNEIKAISSVPQVHNLAVNILENYNEIIQNNSSQNTNSNTEINLNEIDQKVLKVLLDNFKQLKAKNTTFTEKLEPMVTLALNLQRSITLIKQRSMEFADTIKDSHIKLMIKNGNYDSFLQTITKINDSIKSELSSINIEE